MMNTPQKLALLDALGAEYPGYDIRLLDDDDKTPWAERRYQKARKDGRKFISPGWLFIGYCGDLMRRFGIE